jgi:hypothetical protein
LNRPAIGGSSTRRQGAKKISLNSDQNISSRFLGVMAPWRLIHVLVKPRRREGREEESFCGVGTRAHRIFQFSTPEATADIADHADQTKFT